MLYEYLFAAGEYYKYMFSLASSRKITLADLAQFLYLIRLNSPHTKKSKIEFFVSFLILSLSFFIVAHQCGVTKLEKL